MSVEINYPISLSDLETLSDDGYTDLTLWYSNYPEGPFTVTGTAANQTIAAAIAAEDYEFTFEYTAGTPGQYFKVIPYTGAAYGNANDSPPFPGGGGHTLAYVRRVLGTLLHDMVVGTTTSAGNTTTAISTTLEIIREPDDHFNAKYFHRLSNGDKTLVTDFIKSSGTFTLGPAITSVGSGVDFEITSKWTPVEYLRAINEAVESSYPVLNRNVVHEGYLTAENVFDYTVPADIRTVSKVEIGDITDSTTGNHPWREIPFKQYKDGLTRKIEFKRQPPFELGARPLRIWGTGPLQQVSADTDCIEVDGHQVLLLVYKAAFHLYTWMAAKSASTDRAYFQEMAKFYLSLYSEAKVGAGTGRQPKRNWSQTARWGRPPL